MNGSQLDIGGPGEIKLGATRRDRLRDRPIPRLYGMGRETCRTGGACTMSTTSFRVEQPMRLDHQRGHACRARFDEAGRRPVGSVFRADVPARGPMQNEIFARWNPLGINHKSERMIRQPEEITFVVVDKLLVTILS